MFAQRDLEYWLQDSEVEVGCETRYVGSTQEAKAASVLPFVMNEWSIRYWYQSGGCQGVEAVVYVISDQRNDEVGLLALVETGVQEIIVLPVPKRSFFDEDFLGGVMCERISSTVILSPFLLSLER